MVVTITLLMAVHQSTTIFICNRRIQQFKCWTKQE